jgi:hypothetical protein
LSPTIGTAVESVVDPVPVVDDGVVLGLGALDPVPEVVDVGVLERAEADVAFGPPVWPTTAAAATVRPTSPSRVAQNRGEKNWRTLPA